MEENKKSASPKKTAPIACRTVSCSSTSGWIAFLGVFRTHYMAEVGGYRFVVFVRIWTKIGRFCGPKAKWNTWNTRNTWNTWNTVCGCSDCFFVNISKISVAKLRMAFTEGKTNRECSYFLGGLAIWRWLQRDGSSAIKAAECFIRMGCDVSLQFGACSERNKKTKASAHGSVDGGKDYSSIIC